MIGVVQAKAAQVKQTQPQEGQQQSEQHQAQPVTVTPAAAAAAGGFLSLFKGKRSDATAKSPTQVGSAYQSTLKSCKNSLTILGDCSRIRIVNPPSYSIYS